MPNDVGGTGNASVLGRLDQIVNRWRWLLWVGIVVGVAIGFDFKTPAAQFRALTAADGLLSAWQDSLDRAHGQINRYLRALAIAQCIDRPRRETDLMGLPCVSLLQGGSP